MLTEFAKIGLLNAASNLAAAVMANLPDTLPSDPEISDPTVQAENLMAFRLTHVFYDGLCRALNSQTGWNTPELGVGVSWPSWLTAGGAIRAVIQQIIGKLIPGGDSIVSGILDKVMGKPA